MKKISSFVLTSLATITYAFAGFSISTSNWSLSVNQGGNGGPLLSLLATAQTLVSRLVPFAIGLAVLALFWYLILFIWKGGEEPAKRVEGIKGMLYAVIAIFVMVSIWGIITVISNILGVGVGGSLPALEMPKAR